MPLFIIYLLLIKDGNVAQNGQSLSKIAMFRIFKYIPTLWTVNSVFPKPFYLLYKTEYCQQNLRKLHIKYLCDFRNTSATLFNVLKSIYSSFNANS